MRGLLLKDMYLLKDNRMLVGVMLAMAIIFVNINSDASFLVAFMTMISSMLVVTTISYDDFDHSNAFLMTLPISRQMYVQEKYCLGLLMAGGGWFISSIVATVIQTISVPDLNIVEWIITLCALITIGIIAISIMIPVQLKFGGDKGRLVMMGCFLFLFLAAGGIIGVCKLAHVDMEGLARRILQMNKVYISGLIFVVTAAFFLISYRISSRVMMKKQF